ncbi:24999_t:CDS:2, partial [Gigaspora rosea]
QKKKLQQLVNFEETKVEMCINSCLAFTEEFIVKFVLRIQYADPTRAIQLRCRANYKQDNETIRDIYDGKLYKEILEEGLLSDDCDIVFSASLDGYQIFEQQHDDCWVILMINNNLSPEIRVKKENLLVIAIIPGPKQPKIFNTFMRPLINELKQLEEGMLCWNAVTNENFTLHAHVIFWFGDIPAISKL